MRISLLIIGLFVMMFSFAQEEDTLQAIKKSNKYVDEGNELIEDDDFVAAEVAYRKAISKQPTTVAGNYNLGNAYYKKGNFDEALYRHEQAAKTATTKSEKHKAFHNIGNVLMKNKKCKEAVEAYKNALRNNPADNETRYNLALAQKCAEQQKDKQDDKEDKKKDNKEKKDDKKNKGDDKKEKNKDKGDDSKEESKDKKDDKGQPKDSKPKEGQPKEEPKKTKPGQLSPQQIKNLLEAMDNQEQKVQEKMNLEKQKGVKIKTEKDW